MDWYMIQFSLSSEMWSQMISEPEFYTGDVVRRVIERFGGQFHSLWFMSGQYDGFVICQLPDRQSAAAVSFAFSATAMCKDVRTIMLLTLDEARAAIVKATGRDLPPSSPPA